MKTSNLAQCLEEFAATEDAKKESLLRMIAATDCGTARRAPRRLSFDTRRIQIRDTGLRRFRVF